MDGVAKYKFSGALRKCRERNRPSYLSNPIIEAVRCDRLWGVIEDDKLRTFISLHRKGFSSATLTNCASIGYRRLSNWRASAKRDDTDVRATVVYTACHHFLSSSGIFSAIGPK